MNFFIIRAEILDPGVVQGLRHDVLDLRVL